jgi:hypothetical protein
MISTMGKLELSQIDLLTREQLTAMIVELSRGTPARMTPRALDRLSTDGLRMLLLATKLYCVLRLGHGNRGA